MLHRSFAHDVAFVPGEPFFAGKPDHGRCGCRSRRTRRRRSRLDWRACGRRGSRREVYRQRRDPSARPTMQQQPVDVLQVAEAPEVGDVHAPALGHRRPYEGTSKSSRSRPTDSRRACRTSRGARGDVGDNPCSRQADEVVVAALDRRAGRWLRRTARSEPPAVPGVRRPSAAQSPWRLSHKSPSDPVRRSVMGRPHVQSARTWQASGTAPSPAPAIRATSPTAQVPKLFGPIYATASMESGSGTPRPPHWRSAAGACKTRRGLPDAPDNVLTSATRSVSTARSLLRLG